MNLSNAIKPHTRQFHRLAAAGVLLTCFGFITSRASAFTVHDPGNAALLVQQLASQAEQISHHAQQVQNQIRQIQNQVESLQNQAKMLQDLDISNYQEAIEAMRMLETTLRDNCIDVNLTPNRIGYTTGFDCRELLEQFRRAYPESQAWPTQNDEQIAQYPDQWNSQKRDAAAKALQMQNASVETMQGAQQRMAQLAGASKRSPGQKATQQVTNEMLVTISAQLRDQQAAMLAWQRAAALREAEEAAWYERNKELVRRVTRDARHEPSLQPVRHPFGRAGHR